MRCIISPVTSASVSLTEKAEERKIGKGLLIYFAVSSKDIWDEEIEKKIEKLIKKLKTVKFFWNEELKKIDQGIWEYKWEILLISNFTLYGNMQKGNKIDFSDSGLFDYSQNIYNKVIGELEKSGTPFKTGEFGAKMEVSSTNLGPLNYIFEF